MGWWAQRYAQGRGGPGSRPPSPLSKGVRVADVPTFLSFAFLLCSEDSNRDPTELRVTEGTSFLEDVVRPSAAVLGGRCRLRAPAGWGCFPSALGGSCRRVRVPCQGPVWAAPGHGKRWNPMGVCASGCSPALCLARRPRPAAREAARGGPWPTAPLRAGPAPGRSHTGGGRGHAHPHPASRPQSCEGAHSVSWLGDG